jgi:hypothetical protein
MSPLRHGDNVKWKQKVWIWLEYGPCLITYRTLHNNGWYYSQFCIVVSFLVLKLVKSDDVI